MRVVVTCVLSFVLALIVGIFIVAGTAPTHKPKPRSQPKPTKLQAQAAPNLEMLPALPSFRAARIDVSPNQYEEAEQLLKARRYRAAENAYLQILMRRPNDRKALEGLLTALRLRANQDPRKLQEDAAEYRRAIAEGRVTEENYTPREMELLAEASLLAANEIKAEHHLKAGVPSRVATSATAAHPAVSTRGNAPRRSPSPAAPPIATAQPTAKGSVERPRPVSQTTVAATVPASGASRPSATVPPVVASPREKSPSDSPIGPRQVPVTQPTPDSAQTQTLDVTQSSPSGSVAPDAYVLGPGDQIEVNVPHLVVRVTIKQDGMIALPLISPVKAAGKTTAQLTSDLTNMYSKVLAAPSVTVFVQQRLNH